MIPGTTVPAALVGVWEGARVLTPLDGAGIVTDAAPDATWGVTVAFGRGERRPLGYLARDLHLDLTHRPTRLEVMARLGARAGADVGEGVLWFRMFARRTWMIDGVAGVSATWSCDDDGAASLLPALADLDPTDDTRLPDGARVVDVRALAIVCQHVFGGAA